MIHDVYIPKDFPDFELLHTYIIQFSSQFSSMFFHFFYIPEALRGDLKQHLAASPLEPLEPGSILVLAQAQAVVARVCGNMSCHRFGSADQRYQSRCMFLYMFDLLIFSIVFSHVDIFVGFPEFSCDFDRPLLLQQSLLQSCPSRPSPRLGAG